jgi:uncharacterized protein (TIGR03083 family)
MVDLDDVLHANSRQFRMALAMVAADAPVPSCPEWTAADLLWHLTQVQHRWGSIVASRALTREEAFLAGSPARPQGWAESLALFDEVSAHLSGALASAVDSEPAWTWSAEQSIGWVRRRQAHEALIHRVDAQLVSGPPGGIPTEVAQDGVDEVIGKFRAAVPDWGTFEPAGPLVVLESRDSGRRWAVRIGRFHGVDADGTTYDEPDFVAADPVEDAVADAILTAPAADLLLWLWGRAGAEVLSVRGLEAAVGALREAVAANTQ